MNLPNNILIGSKRDSEVLESIDTCGVLNTQQITALHFPIKSGKRKCQERMQSLYERKLVKRIRISVDSPYVYFINRPSLMNHSLAISWAYVWMVKTRKVQTWELEQLEEFGLRCDALCSVRNDMAKETFWYCIEFESSSNKSQFEKIEKYNKLYDKEGIKGSKLMQRLNHPDRFPRVIIVTDTAKKGIRIRDAIQSEKRIVNFEVMLLSEIIREVTQCTL